MPILGMLPAVRRDPTGVFMRAASRFGDVVYFKIGPRRGYLLTNPADIRHVLQDNARNYHKSPLYQKLRMSIGNGLLTSEDDFWLRQRRIAQPAFHRQRVAGLAGVMARAARETADQWQSIASDGRSVDISDEMMRFTRTVVLRALLGGDLGPFAAKIDQAWVVINENIGNSFWSLGIAERFQRARARQFAEARIVLRQAVDYVINERRRHPTESPDLLSMLMSARDEETGERMTDEQLRVEVTTFLLAGQETTSLALTWTWFLLSQHPAARQRLEDEIDTALGGFHLPSGWLAFVIPYVLHRLPQNWTDPDAFEPERFSPEQSADRPKFAYIPFGAGPRQCIGNQFALIEAHLSVATLA
jgi:cytochrome P450